MSFKNLFLKPNEVRVIALAILDFLDQNEAAQKNENLNWTPEARKDMREMSEAANAVKLKWQKLGYNMDPLTYNEGDENEFLTKES